MTTTGTARTDAHNASDVSVCSRGPASSACWSGNTYRMRLCMQMRVCVCLLDLQKMCACLHVYVCVCVFVTLCANRYDDPRVTASPGMFLRLSRADTSQAQHSTEPTCAMQRPAKHVETTKRMIDAQSAFSCMVCFVLTSSGFDTPREARHARISQQWWARSPNER